MLEDDSFASLDPSFRSIPIVSGPTWFCLRRSGKPLRDGWLTSVSDPDIRAGVSPDLSDVIEICVADHFSFVPLAAFSQVFISRARGLVGIEFSMGDLVRRYAPTRMIADNLSFGRVFERFLFESRCSVRQFRARGAIRLFLAAQALLPGSSDIPPVDLFRGSTLIDLSSSSCLASDIAQGIERWMLSNLTSGGAFPYQYWPSLGKYSRADNAIRRFLASIGLARLARLRRSVHLHSCAQRNLRFNLRRFFRSLGDGRGVIVEGKSAKLGAASLAGLAILEASSPTEFGDEIRQISSAVASLAGGSFGFRTFFFPSVRDGQNWNFYSGETLLFWAEAQRRGAPGAPSLSRCAAVFERCYRYHLLRRNPAFVPWCTQAAASLFLQTGNRAFAEAVFDMNDWLTSMQQWDGVDPDLRGRFYDPSRPHFGIPHASSTGVYLEGLVDATSVARLLGCSRRATAYATLVQRGLRSLRQLQFRDATDAFYVSSLPRVLGALRTEVYENSIRLDNMAHALAACIKVLELTSRQSPD